MRLYAIPPTGITLPLPRMVVSPSEILRAQGTFKFEHMSVGGCEHLYQILAINAGGWEIFINRAVKKMMKVVELY